MWPSVFSTSSLESLSNDEGEGNENGKKKEKKKTGLDLQNKTNKLHVFLYISLSSLRDYHVKLPHFTFCRGRKHKTNFVVLFLNFATHMEKGGR